MVEVLAQRPRRRRGRLLLLVAMAISLSACAPTPAGGEGVVVGGVIPCAGLAPPPGEQYAAAAVAVLDGIVHWQTTGPGTSRAVLPPTVEASEIVSTNQEYGFSLRPGTYVLYARIAGSASFGPFIDIDVAAGSTQSVNIPNDCL